MIGVLFAIVLRLFWLHAKKRRFGKKNGIGKKKKKSEGSGRIHAYTHTVQISDYHHVALSCDL